MSEARPVTGCSEAKERSGIALFEAVVAIGLTATMLGFGLQAYVMCYRFAARANERFERLQAFDEFSRMFCGDVRRAESASSSNAGKSLMIKFKERGVVYTWNASRQSIDRQSDGARETILEGIQSVQFFASTGSTLVHARVRFSHHLYVAAMMRNSRNRNVR